MTNYLSGVNGTAKVFTNIIEEKAREQVVSMMNSPITEGTQVRIMPDVHAGAGATIGTTIKLGEDRSKWKISPNVVGVDIGCGMMSVRLAEKELNFKVIDEVIAKYIPSGRAIHSEGRDDSGEVARLLSDLTFELRDEDRIIKSLGTLGGGNHFIEIAKDEEEFLWLTVHSGSRGLGVEVARRHQKIAEKEMVVSREERTSLIADLKERDLSHLIESELAKLTKKNKAQVQTIAYLTGSLLDDYLHDIALAQKYAYLNRRAMLLAILKGAGLAEDTDSWLDSIHNYIDLNANVVRKGATDAAKGTKLIIPLNMRDGSLICVGKGNDDWNNSAPHGAGRRLSRTAAKATLSFDSYRKQMEGVYTTSVVESTLDEAPSAYKPMGSILENIGDTVEILHHLKPVYNYKAH